VHRQTRDTRVVRVAYARLVGCLSELQRVCMLAVFTLWVATQALYLGALNAAQTLHSLMLTNVLRTPVAFFDVTPAGRLLNRFGKDVDVLDSTLPMSLRGWFNCFLSVGRTIHIALKKKVPLQFEYYSIDFYVFLMLLICSISLRSKSLSALSLRDRAVVW